MVGKIEKICAEEHKHIGDATSLVYKDEIIYTGGADGIIKVWDKDLNHIRDIPAHEAYVYALAINSKGRLYSSSCDGTVRYFENPKYSDNSIELMRSNSDDIGALYCVDDTFYTGDDKGVVCKWVDNKIEFKFNLIEEVKSLAVENNLIYTARDLDAVVSLISDGKSGKYSTKATMPGKSPLALIGTVDPATNQSKYLVFVTRDGKGITLVRNETRFQMVWTKNDAHEMIINTICSTDGCLYTAGWDGKIKKWVELENSPQILSEVDTGACVNAICNGALNTVYSVDTNGYVKRSNFSTPAA